MGVLENMPFKYSSEGKSLSAARSGMNRRMYIIAEITVNSFCHVGEQKWISGGWRVNWCSQRFFWKSGETNGSRRMAAFPSKAVETQ